jgi:regulatory protein
MPALPPPASRSSPYQTALRMLSARELSVAQVRERLRARGFPPEAIETVLERLQANGALDDRRTARAYARSALQVKRRGRLRVLRELEALGVDRLVSREAVAEVFADVDERQLIRAALDRRHPDRITDAGAYRRLFQYLARLGFAPDAITAVLRSRAKP